MRTALLTALTLVSFAANSVLCRLALGGGHIDAASFTSVRFVSGACVLWLLSFATGRSRSRGTGTWTSATALAVYGIGFSFAYVSLSTGMGALLLFAAVQTTMMVLGFRAGERPAVHQWAGFVLSLGGFVYLVSPGLSAPDPGGSALMVAAGVGWGVYSVRGRGAADPIGTTTDNFIRSLPFVIGASLVFIGDIRATTEGIVLALISGSVTSGLGYVLWYAALRGLTTTRAAIVQLSVPVLTAVGGILFLSEEPTMRLLVASLLILGGIGAAVGKWRA